MSGLSVGYHGKAILQGLNLSAGKCELVALIGRNGTGKSTLMRTIAYLQPAISGDAIIAGKSLKQYTRSELAGVLSIVSTETVGSLHLSVKQLVAYGRFPYTNWIGRLSDDDKVLIQDAMRLVGIEHLADKNLFEISDGERQKAMIARTIAQDTDLILLDEPTAFLDMPNKYEIIRLLHHFTRVKKKTIIFSTHDLNIAMQEADKLWLMEGRSLHEGAPEDLVLNHQLARIFEGTKLLFDDHRGEFKIKRTDNKSIVLSGEGKVYFWTKKALERMGYKVDKRQDNKLPQSDEVEILEMNPTVWELRHGSQIQKFDSLYSLAKYLLFL